VSGVHPAKKRRGPDRGLEHNPMEEHEHVRAELDTHADTCVFGHCCLIVNDTGDTVSVEGFDKSMTVNEIPVVTAVIAYDCPATFETYLTYFTSIKF